MLTAGLLSVTFRNLSPEEVIQTALRAHLPVLEWGGDIHVPPGRTELAQQLFHRCREAGIRCAAYGSYYRTGEPDQPDFHAVADTALALGASTVRVWAGARGSAEADAEYRRIVWADTARICRIAEEKRLTVTFEFHSGTLTDSIASLLALRQAADSPAFRSGWQPTVNAALQQRQEELREVLPFLSTMHVFHWHPGTIRRPLADGASEWRDYLRIAAGCGRDIPVMLEFVRDDSVQQLLEDAQTLRNLLAALDAETVENTPSPTNVHSFQENAK